MRQNLDLYNYDAKIARALSRIKMNKGIKPSNLKKIIQFHQHLTAEGIGNARIIRYLNDLPQIEKLLNKKFEDAKTNDFELIINKLQSKGYSPNTMTDFKKTIKKFYKWLNKGELPESVTWIKTKNRSNNHKIPEELLTEEEIKKMIQTATNIRDRAIISVLWESGCRAGELLGLQIKHVVFEETLSRIIIKGKTGMRRVPLIDSTPYLAEWLDYHPFPDDSEAPLWVGIGSVGRDQQLQYSALRKMLAQVKKKAQIKKQVNPHNFRHSRATVLARHLKEAELNQYLGWVQGSNIPAIYVHLSGRDMDDAVLKMRGIEPKEEKHESSLAPKQCSRCDSTNKGTSNFCTKCGGALDVETAFRMKEKIDRVNTKVNEIWEDPEVQDLLKRKLREMSK